MDHKKYRVSIILCVYNGEKYLQKQLDSIVAQQYPPWELIVMDDGSTDSSLEILASYEGKLPLQIIRNESNLGYIKNFEKGISLAQGELIALADQDDIWKPEKLALQVDMIKEHELVYADSAFIDAEGEFLGNSMGGIRNFIRGKSYQSFLLDNCVSGHNVLFKSDLKQYILPFHPSFHYDWWIALVASAKGSIDYSTEKLVLYRQHAQNITDALKKSKKQKESSSLKKMRREVFEKHLERLEYFYNNPVLDGAQKEFTGKMIQLYTKKKKSFFVFSLFVFLFQNRKKLYAISKKSSLKIFLRIFRESFGV